MPAPPYLRQAMKNRIATAAVGFFAAALILIVPACKKEDPCADNCVHGFCADGDCVCDDGFTGQWCSTANNGKLMVWNSNPQPCPAGAGTIISIYIDGAYVGGIGNWYSSEPVCDASGAITRTLDVGNHSVSGQCGTTTWGPTIMTVVAGGCSKLQFY